MIEVLYRNYSRLNRIKVNSLDIKMSENEASKASFTVVIDDFADMDWVPKIANEIVIRYTIGQESYKIFAGYIISVKYEFVSRDRLWFIHYDAIDYNHILDRYIIPPVNYKQVSVYDILTYMLKNISNEYIGVWQNDTFKAEPVESGVSTKRLMVLEFKTQYITAKQFLRQIQDLYPQLKFWIDYNRVFHVYTEDKTPVFTIDLNSNTVKKGANRVDISIYKAELDLDTTDFRNRQYIRGGAVKTEKVSVIKREDLPTEWYLTKEQFERYKNDDEIKESFNLSPKLYEQFYTFLIIKKDIVNGKAKYRFLPIFVAKLDATISEALTMEAERQKDLDDFTTALSSSYADIFGVEDASAMQNLIVGQKPKDKPVVYVYFSFKTNDGEIIYTVPEPIGIGVYDEDSELYVCPDDAIWFYIPGTSEIWRKYPLAKYTYYNGKKYEFKRLEIKIQSSTSIVTVVKRDVYINDMFNPKVVEGYVGYWDNIVSESSIKDPAEATRVANAYLDEYCKIPKRISLEVSKPILKPGDIVRIKFNPLFQDVDFRVKEVSINDIAGKDIRVNISAIASEIPSWVDYFRKIIATKRDIEVDEFMSYTIYKDEIRIQDNVQLFYMGDVENCYVGEAVVN